MKSLFLVICSFVFSFNALAVGEVNEFKVVLVRADQSGSGYVKFDQPLEGTPASCISGGHDYHLSFDLNTPGGKGIMSLVLSAQATGKSIKAKGTGSCEGYGVVERWNYGWIIN